MGRREHRLARRRSGAHRRHRPLGLGLLPVLTYGSLFTTVFGGTDTARLSAASPARLVRIGAPPFEIVYASGDLAGLAPDALRFAATLGQRGIPVTLVDLSAADIPPGVPVTVLGEHASEIMAVNTRDFDSRPARAIADFARRVISAPPGRAVPNPRPGQPYPQSPPPEAALTAR